MQGHQEVLWAYGLADIAVCRNHQKHRQCG
jgi:hypothetical protein